ncbi:MAG: HD domain-containing protein, partial [Spirochaetia bacterium]|nr:HD domain-containing protein [Spirochaetia bacterium]
MTDTEQHLIDLSADYTKIRMKDVRPSHGFDHVQRVLENAKRIAAAEKDADIFIVTAAALLHDIARNEEDMSSGKICHAERGAALALDFLLSHGLESGRAGHISRCILTHRFRKNNAPDTIEAKILFDADKLDSIGAIGIGRAFLFAGEVGALLHNPDIQP